MQHRFRFLAEFAQFLLNSDKMFLVEVNPDGSGKFDSEEIIDIVNQRGVLASRCIPFSKMTPGQQANMIKNGYDPNNLNRPEPSDDDSDPTNYAYFVRMDLVEPRFRQGNTNDTGFMLMPFEKMKNQGVRGCTIVYDDNTHTSTIFNNRLN